MNEPNTIHPTLPPLHPADPSAALTLRRTWPVSKHPGQLAVEFHSPAGIRAGTWDSTGLRLLPAGQDPKLPALARLLDEQPSTAAQPWGELISHRAGKRAVVRSLDGSSYCKLVRTGQAGSVLAGIGRAEAFNTDLRTPEVISWDDSSVELSAVAGESMHQPSAFTAEEWTAAWTQILQAWESAGKTPGGFSATNAVSRFSGKGVEQKLHTAEDEVAVLGRWFDLVSPWLADAPRAQAAVRTMVQRLRQLPQVQPRPTHRDLHDQQLLWSAEQGPALLDVDTACLADPALDLGNLRAHATLRRLQELWAPGEAETVFFCVDLTAEHLGVPRSTLAVYEQAALLRLGFVYAVRPQYAELAAQLRALFSS